MSARRAAAGCCAPPSTSSPTATAKDLARRRTSRLRTRQPVRRHGTSGRGRRFGIAPLADGRVYWFATTVATERAHLHDDLGAVAARFDGWHEPIPHLLAATPPTALIAHDIYHLATPLRTYTAGRVVLLGDAVHAVTPDLGQGAAQALEAAVVLTAVTTVHSDHGDIGSALAGYDRLRRPRTQRRVRAPVARLANARHRPTAWLRDIAARALPTSAYLSASADTFGWQPPTHPRMAPDTPTADRRAPRQ